MDWNRLGGLMLGGAVLALAGCSGDGSDAGGGTSSGSVSLYLTDDLADYQHVIATLTDVQLVHTGSGEYCDLLVDPQPLDIPELGTEKLLELADITTCPARTYNRLHLELDENVELTDINNVTRQCRFRSYKDHGNQPNILFCQNGICRLDLNGAVDVLAGGHDDVTLDFDLKEFEVGMNGADCDVTLKVSPIHASDKMQALYQKALKGRVTGLDLSARRFALAKGNDRYTVDFSGVTQSGLASLLERAAADGLQTRVRCTVFDDRTAACTVSGDSAISVAIEGIASGVDLGLKVFTLTYMGNKNLDVDYTHAGKIEGAPENGNTIEARLYGHDGARFLASQVEAK